MWYFIKPFDTVMFRDGRPFDAGAGHAAESVFPPTPTPFIGALRAVMFRRKGALPGRVGERDEVLGGVDDLGTLRGRGPLLARRTPQGLEPFFPVPITLLIRKDLPPLSFLPLRDAIMTVGDRKLHPLWAHGAGETPADQFVSGSQLLTYLAGGSPAMAPGSDLYLKEDRVGIALEQGQKKAAEGMLYVARIHRLVDMPARPHGAIPSSPEDEGGFLFDLTTDPKGDGPIESLLDRSGLIALGGERRPASYSAVDATDLKSSPLDTVLSPEEAATRITANSGPPWRVLACLVTPGLFPLGWLPGLPDETTLMAAAVGKPRPVGGWDLVRRAPRTMRRAVPAGSVYFLESKQEPGKICDLLSGRPWPGQLDAAEQYGYGLTVLGGWDYV